MVNEAGGSDGSSWIRRERLKMGSKRQWLEVLNEEPDRLKEGGTTKCYNAGALNESTAAAACGLCRCGARM
ncbi:hypothetical protein WN943_011308 [Citrus x changshan-huyou]